MRALTIAALGLAATASYAQFEGAGEGLSLKIGGAYFFDNTTRNQTGDLALGLGAELTFGNSLFGRGETFFAVDWMSRGLSGNRGNILYYTVNQRFYDDDSFEVEDRRYFFVGVGFATVDVVSSRTVFALRGGAGVEFSRNLFAEATLFLSESVSGASGNGVGVFVGYRF